MELVDEVDGFLSGEFLAVVAAKFEVFFVDDVEFGGNGLEVGDAFGVGALDKVLDVVGDFGGEFLDDVVVLNGDDGDRGGHESHFTDILFGEVLVLDFDDAFAAEFSLIVGINHCLNLSFSFLIISLAKPLLCFNS